MKITDILLEYDRARAAQAVGPRLWQAMVRDILGMNISLNDFQRRMEVSYPSAYRQYKSVFDNKKSQEQLANNALEKLEAADPTTNKKYTQWLARMFASDTRTKLEDIGSTAAEYLHKFNILSRKKLLKPEHADLNRFKDLKTFMDVLDQYELPEEDEQVKGKAEKLYSDGNVTVIHPQDEAAACAYGRQTRWCTAATKGMNYFDNYNARGPMYILIPKSPTHQGEKYQLHFVTGQFMNEDDEPVPLTYILKDRFPSLFEFFAKREREHIEDLIEFTSDETLQPILTSIYDIMIDWVNDWLADWEVNDDHYYRWLRDEGYVDEEGDIKDNAPSYFEYNDEVRTTYNKMIDAIKLTPDELKKLTAEYVKEYSPEDAMTVREIEEVMSWNFLEEFPPRRNVVGGALKDYMIATVHIFKKDGKWQVKRIDQRR